jgi:cytidylate kinase
VLLNELESSILLQTISRKKKKKPKKQKEHVKIDLDALPVHHIIIDCSPCNFIDSMGANAIYQVQKYSNQFIFIK